MNVQRTVLLGALCGAVAVWLASAATSTSRAPVEPIVPRAAATDISSEALAAEIGRLHERLRPGVAPTESRDLFRYSARPSRVEPVDMSPSLPDAVVAVPPTPVYALIGVAEDAGADGPVRTAIVSGQGQLLFLKVGDTIGGQYRVERVEPEAIELQDHAGTMLRLALK